MKQYFENFSPDSVYHNQRMGVAEFTRVFPFIMYYQFGDLYRGNKVVDPGVFMILPQGVTQQFGYRVADIDKSHPQQPDVALSVSVIAQFNRPPPTESDIIMTKFWDLCSHRDNISKTLSKAREGLVNMVTAEIMMPDDPEWKTRYNLLRKTRRRLNSEIKELADQFPDIIRFADAIHRDL